MDDSTQTKRRALSARKKTRRLEDRGRKMVLANGEPPGQAVSGV